MTVCQLTGGSCRQTGDKRSKNCLLSRQRLKAARKQVHLSTLVTRRIGFFCGHLLEFAPHEFHEGFEPVALKYLDQERAVWFQKLDGKIDRKLPSAYKRAWSVITTPVRFGAISEITRSTGLLSMAATTAARPASSEKSA